MALMRYAHFAPPDQGGPGDQLQRRVSMGSQVVSAVILAGGFGTRLGTLTCGTPKPLLAVAGRPFLARTMDTLCTLPRVSEVVIVANSVGAAAFDAFAEEYRPRCAVRIHDTGARSVSELQPPLHCVVAAADAIGVDRPILVLVGDIFVPKLASIEAAFDSKEITLGLVRLAPGTPCSQYGVAVVDADGRVESFEEKPQCPKSEVVSTGAYLLPPGALRLLAGSLADPSCLSASIGRCFEWALAHANQLRGHIFPGRMFDIGDSPAAYESVCRTLAGGSVSPS